MLFEFTMKRPDKITYLCGADGSDDGVACVFVETVRLFIDTCRTQPVQTIDMASQKQKGVIENLAFIEAGAQQQEFSANGQIVVPNQKDLQEIVLAFPTVPSTGRSPVYDGVDVNGAPQSKGYGRNPLQYHSAFIDSLSPSYAGEMPFRNKIEMGTNNRDMNVMAYTLYRKSCGADLNNIVPLALSRKTFQYYNLYYLPFYKQTLVHRNTEAKDVRIDATSAYPNAGLLGGQTTYQSFAILRKFQGVQIDSTGSVERLNA
jgi:hypothetical protein